MLRRIESIKKSTTHRSLQEVCTIDDWCVLQGTEENWIHKKRQVRRTWEEMREERERKKVAAQVHKKWKAERVMSESNVNWFTLPAFIALCICWCSNACNDATVCVVIIIRMSISSELDDRGWREKKKGEEKKTKQAALCTCKCIDARRNRILNFFLLSLSSSSPFFLSFICAISFLQFNERSPCSQVQWMLAISTQVTREIYARHW